jgi:hypothetical protein
MHLGHDPEHVGSAGHNSSRPVSQWQTPHLPRTNHPEPSGGETDIDLVEDAFIEAFARAPDPTSFLRLAGVPLAGESADGTRYCLLRVEISQKTDIGSLSPYLGAAGHRYDPLPATLVSRRQAATLVYFDGKDALHLSLNEARGLKQAPTTP